MTSFNKPQELRLGDGNIIENFNNFKQEVEIYFKATETDKKPKEVQVARLLNLLGKEGLKVYNTFKKNQDETVESILKEFEEYCAPKKNEVVQHFRFFSRKQQDGESFDHYLTELKHLIQQCDFGTVEEKLLRTQIILGISDKDLQSQLLKDDPSLKQVVAYCQAVEVVEVHQKAIESTVSTVHAVKSNKYNADNGQAYQDQGGHNMCTNDGQMNQTQGWRKKCTNDDQMNQEQSWRMKYNVDSSQAGGGQSNQTHSWRNKYGDEPMKKFHDNETFKCRRCSSVHGPRNCPAFGKQCRNCGQYGHFSSGCRRSSNNDSKDHDRKEEYHMNNRIHGNGKEEYQQKENRIHGNGIHGIKEVKVKTNDEFNVDSLRIDTVSEVFTILSINNVPIRFKIDTGSCVNIIPECIVHEFNVRMEKTQLVFQAFEGTKIYPVGKFKAICEKNNVRAEQEFYVCKDDVALLGLKSLLKFNIIKINDTEKPVLLVQEPQILGDLEREKDQFIDKYRDVFTGLGAFPGRTSLKLKESSIPVANPCRRIPFKIKDKLKETLDLYIKEGIITECEEPCEWVSNLVCVEKSDGSLRLCIDPQELNRNLLRDYYEIPTLNEVSSKLLGKKYFCVFDIKTGFHHMVLDEQSSKICAFSTPYGTYRYLRAPFGLNCISEMFSKKVNQYFGNIKNTFIYVDDIICAADTKEEMYEILEKIMCVARQNNIKFNSAKLQYFVQQVKYVGSIFSKNCVTPDPERIEAMLETQSPRNKKELQGYLGMVNFMRNHIPALSQLIAPMRELLKNNVEFQWSSEQEKSFKQIKAIISQSISLAQFNYDKPITIQADASKDALGGCLLQDNVPISFVSRCLTETEKAYAMCEKELLSITFVMSKFHHFIYGHKNIVVHTDHQPLLSIIKKDLHKIKNNRLKRLKMKLFPYQFELKYLPGKYMYVADYLSRNFLVKNVQDDVVMKDMVHTISKCEVMFSNEKLEWFQNETLEDQDLYKVHQYYQDGWPSSSKELIGEVAHFFKLRSEITHENGLMFYNEKLIVPKKCRNFLLNLAHETHLGYEKIKDKINDIFYWPGLKSDLLNLIQSCKICQTFQKSRVKDKLISHAIPDVPFLKIGMDFAEFGGKSYLVVVDYYSRWLEVFPVNNKDSEVVIKCCKELFARFGIPEEIVADNNPFGSYAFKKFADMWGFKITNSSPHYHQSNGLAEKGVGILKTMLKKCNEDQGDLNLYLLNYRNSPVAGLTYSPAQLMFNKNLRTRFPSSVESLKPKVLENTMKQFEDVKNKQADYYNRSCMSNEVEFTPNEEVLVQNVFSKRWEKGVIIEKLQYPRSYLVRVHGSNNTLRRNIKFIKKFNVRKKYHFGHVNVGRYEYEGNRNMTHSDVGVDESSNHMQENEVSCEDQEENVSGHYRTRSGRVIKPVQRLDV